MKQWLLLVLGLLMVGLLAGCASSGPERDINDPTNSLVFGYIDMDGAPTGVNAASILQVSPSVRNAILGARGVEGAILQRVLAARLVSTIQFFRFRVLRRPARVHNAPPGK